MLEIRLVGIYKQKLIVLKEEIPADDFLMKCHFNQDSQSVYQKFHVLSLTFV